MSSADIRIIPRSKKQTFQRSIPGILRDGSLHPAIDAAQSEGSLMLMRGSTQRLRAQAIEEGEAT